jgi:hypothetical protein
MALFAATLSAETIDKEPIRDFITKQETKIKLDKESCVFNTKDQLIAMRELLLKLVEIEYAKLEEMRKK